MNPKVSIIINTYNMEKFIRHSLESALNQTIQDIEIIVVDNASTDATVSIVRSYQEKDSRIKVIPFEKNRGTLQSRIAGGRAAIAEYLCYLDADDRLHQDFCKIMLRTALEYDVDIVQCSGIDATLAGKLTRNIALETKVHHRITQPEIYRQRLSQNIYVVPWGKLIKTELYQKAIDALEIPEDFYLIAAEDEIQTHACCYFAESYIGIKDKLYYYLVREESETRGARQIKQNILSNVAYLKLFHRFINKYSLENEYQNEIQYEMKLRANLVWSFIIHYGITLEDLPVTELSELLGHDIFVESAQRYPVLQVLRTAKTIQFTVAPSLNKKRIAFLLHRLYNGGVERVVSQYTNALIKKGYEVYLITAEKESSSDYEVSEKAVRLCIGTDTIQQISNLKEFIEQYKLDCICCGYWAHNNVYPLLLARLMGKKVILSFHGYLHTAFLINNPYEQELLINMGQIASVVTVVSRTDMMSWQAAGVSNSVFIPNPLSFESVDMGNCDIDSENLLFVGRIEYMKGIYDLLDAFSVVHKTCPHARLTIVGGPSYTNDRSVARELKWRIDYLGLKKVIDIVGFQKDILPYLLRSSIFCFPTYADSWGMVYAEAKSVGMATVVSALPHLELYCPSDSLQFEIGNTQQLAEKIVYLLQNPAIRREMGRKAKENLKNFDMEISISKFEDLVSALNTDKFGLYIQQKNQEYLSDKQHWLEKSIDTHLVAVRALNKVGSNRFSILASPKLRKLKEHSKSIFPVGSRSRAFCKAQLVSLYITYKKIMRLFQK